MTKITLDKDTFKVLASDTRLNILQSLDGKKMTLTELGKQTSLNKATLHENLVKLHSAGLVKRKEREGHKWIYYKLSWKGASLLHPDNNRIVVMFTATFFVLMTGVLGLFNYLNSIISAEAGEDLMYVPKSNADEGLLAFEERSFGIANDPIFLYIGIACIILFSALFIFSILKYRQNKEQKL